MHLEKLVNSPTGKIITSIVLGFGLATLFRQVCKERNCIIMKAPPLEEIKNSIFKHDNKCYKFEAVSTTCNATNKQLISH